MNVFGPLVTLPNGVTVRCPPAEGIRKAYELRCNGFSYPAISRALTEDPPGYKHVGTADSAKMWVERGKQIAAKRADELSDATTRKVESVTRNLQALARIEVALADNKIKLAEAIALQIKLDQNLDRVVTGVNLPSVMNMPVGDGGRWAVIGLLDGITNRDVAESYLDDYHQRNGQP